jgi:hypothetical protein
VRVARTALTVFSPGVCCLALPRARVPLPHAAARARTPDGRPVDRPSTLQRAPKQAIAVSFGSHRPQLHYHVALAGCRGTGSSVAADAETGRTAPA